MGDNEKGKKGREERRREKELTCGNVPFPRDKQNTITPHVDLSHVCNILYVVYLVGPVPRRARCDDQRHLTQPRKHSSGAESGERAGQALSSTYSRGCPIAWPARSPDLTPLDYVLWGHTKGLIYQTNVESAEEQLARVMAAADLGRSGIGDRVYQNMVQRNAEKDSGHAVKYTAMQEHKEIVPTYFDFPKNIIKGLGRWQTQRKVHFRKFIDGSTSGCYTGVHQLRHFSNNRLAVVGFAGRLVDEGYVASIIDDVVYQVLGTSSQWRSQDVDGGHVVDGPSGCPPNVPQSLETAVDVDEELKIQLSRVARIGTSSQCGENKTEEGVVRPTTSVAYPPTLCRLWMLPPCDIVDLNRLAIIYASERVVLWTVENSARLPHSPSTGGGDGTKMAKSVMSGTRESMATSCASSGIHVFN
ncbi:hypothetical protein PR048_030858 [Dryococelus australis]|uniref:Uncharacterized protein n=1 Tax=Dryococelus australis TaxID=614101 RepID=A0ABQ9GA33_9NEOP|nr:hypothetical protein PR048_030858 [Dryococelus australis]